MEVSRLTEVSPLLNFFNSTLAGEVPRRSQIASVKRGWEDPEKIWTRLMMKSGERCLSHLASCHRRRSVAISIDMIKAKTKDGISCRMSDAVT